MKKKMKKGILGLGLCECVDDWHGKFHGYEGPVNGVYFRLREEVVINEINDRNHIWIDRHHWKVTQLGVQTTAYYHTIIQIRDVRIWKPDPRIFFGLTGTFARYDEYLTTELKTENKPGVEIIIESVKQLIGKIVQLNDFQNWIERFNQSAQFPIHS